MINETVSAKCHECDAPREWYITHRYVNYWGVRHCFRCPQCGTTVPDFAWERYQREGRVVIPVWA